VARVLLLVPTATYRARDFTDAARRLGVDVVVGSEAAQALETQMGERSLVVPMDDPEAAVEAIASLHERAPVDAVVAVDDQGVLVAAAAAAALGLPHNPIEAVAATRDKAAMRRALDAGGVPQPGWTWVTDPTRVHAPEFPCVVKPTRRSGSQGVIRADDEAALGAAVDRVWQMCGGPLLVEEYVPGVEVAVEAIVDHGHLEVLAIFDKPDPLVGPYFEETIYVTPSRLDDETIARVRQLTTDATRAIGLTEGPIHAEIRVDGNRTWVVEVAARSIGGLCARTLRFGAGVSLEELVLRHAIGASLEGLTREPAASGVMMLPIPGAGVLDDVRGQDVARAVPGITGMEITVPRGRRVVPLPEGDRYLGFLFARGNTPEAVESALRRAHDALEVVITP
jgi:biotin carboxylase